MKQGTSIPRWYSPKRREASRAEDDLADMGTAFGLDASLNLLLPEPVLPGKAPEARKSWIARLQMRRKPAA